MLAASTKNTYHWFTALSGAFILLIINGFTSTSTFSLFDKALIAEFGLQSNVSALKFREGLTNGVGAVCIIFSGIVIDRLGVKLVMLAGTALLALTSILFSFATSLYEIYALHALFAISLITAGSMPVIILVSNWFRQKRGTALGIALVGTSLGGVLFPLILNYMMHDLGISWRTTYQLMAILPAVLFFYVWLFIHNSPVNVALLPFGNGIEESNNQLTTGMDYAQAIQTSTFWLIGISGFLSFYAVVGISSNIFLHLSSVGFSDKQAAIGMSIFFFFSASGKLIISSLSDHINPYRVLTYSMFGMALGALGCSMANGMVIYVAIAFTAIHWGGIYTMYNIIIVQTFGLKSAGKINGSISFFESMGAFAGPYLTAVLFDMQHSYKFAFMAIAGMMMIAFLLSFQFKPSTVV